MTADFTFVSPDGVEIGCRVTGAGPALLLVHGTATDHLCFERIFSRLEGHFTLYQMDRRGRGLSGDGPDWSPDKEFADVAAGIDAIAAAAGGPINLFGHSFGGLCCLEAAPRTDNIRRMVLYDPIMMGLAPHDGNRGEIIAEMEAALAAGDPERVTEIHFTRWLGRSPASVARRRRDAEAWARRVALAPTMIREYTTPRVYAPDPARIEGVSVPLRVLIGEESGSALQVSTRWVKEHLPAAEVIEIPGHGHYAFNGDPETFAGLLIGFYEAG